MSTKHTPVESYYINDGIGIVTVLVTDRDAKRMKTLTVTTYLISGKVEYTITWGGYDNPVRNEATVTHSLDGANAYQIALDYYKDIP
jgi:hypothetical protein